MTWLDVLPYQRVEQELRRQIDEGLLKPGSALPTVAVLTIRFGVARNTARRAVSELVRAGLVEVRPGRGTFVREVEHRDGIDFGDRRSFTWDKGVGDRTVRRLVMHSRGRVLSVDLTMREIAEMGAALSALARRIPRAGGAGSGR